jgi:hypothetical protein
VAGGTIPKRKDEGRLAKLGAGLIQPSLQAGRPWAARLSRGEATEGNCWSDLIYVFVWDMCSKQLDSDMLAADVPEGQADEESK